VGIASACLLAAAFAAPRATPAQRVLVLSLKSSGVDTMLARNLSEVFASAVRKNLPGTTVIGQDDIDRMLEVEKQRDLLGCADNVSCLIEIGGALGADVLAVGSVGKVGGVYLLTLKLIRARDATTLAHVAERVEGEEELIEATVQWGAHLVDPERKAPLGYAEIGGEGVVRVGDLDLGTAPVHRFPLTPGVQPISWTSKEGVVRRNVVIEPYRVTRVVPVEANAPIFVAAQEPVDARRGWAASAGGGLYSILLGGNDETTHGLLTSELDVGYTLDNGWMLGLTFRTANGGAEGAYEVSTYGGGVRIGPLSSGRFALQPSLAIGMMRATATGPATGAVEQTATLPHVEAALALRYGVWRNLSIGAQASYFIQPPVGDVPDSMSNYTAHLGAAARIFVEGHADSDFNGVLYDGPGYWWLAWGAGATALLALNLFIGGGDGEGPLGTVVVK
jgi:hypothetical protein